MDMNEDRGRLIVTPHPVLIDDQRNIVCDLRPGETLYAFLQRHITDLDGDAWICTIGGVQVPRHMWLHVKPKHNQIIEVRHKVSKTALYIIAMVALAYFTAGASLAVMGGGTFLGLSGAAASVAIAGVQILGSMLINKVLGPKPPKPPAVNRDAVYSIGGTRNSARVFEPVGILFGSVRVAPDLISAAYTWFESNENYLAMQMTPGINVVEVEELYNGDTLLSNYEGVKVWHSGFSGMPNEEIPFFTNPDTLPGGVMDANVGIIRTTGPNTIRIQADIEFMLFDLTSKGKEKMNQETIRLEYRPAGSTDVWRNIETRTVRNKTQKTQRVTLAGDVPEGTWDVRVMRLGQVTVGSGSTGNFTLNSILAIQKDEADYSGIPRIGVKIRATGQLSGTPDELRCVAHAEPIPVWKGPLGGGWVTERTSNPGAQMLQFARGIRDSEGNLIAGIGLDDQQIDIAAFQAFMLHCAANNYRFDCWIAEPRTRDEMLRTIALAGFGQHTWYGGRLSVSWAAADQPLSGVVNMATIKRATFQVNYQLSNAADGIEYTYYDREVWDTKTLRVPAPGVTTMLNPAQINGEGITTEEHAAKMARWHLAQSLYQYKDISYETDIEHLSYRRMSMLAMQHDLTQWGFGGRVVEGWSEAGTFYVRLDEPVPGPAVGNAYIGFRIPGELVYRVIQVVDFEGESDVLELAEPWPVDAAFPGDTSDNPAHDTLWVYDFKQTPGTRVRVVSIEPDNDLMGASVSVVQEDANFWNYVNTGEYIPSDNGSSLQTRPTVSGTVIEERQVNNGNVTYTELTAKFTVSGPYSHAAIMCGNINGVLSEVAQTNTLTASWRIDGEGEYAIVVRPFNRDGFVGVSETVIYATVNAGLPPRNYDFFEVQQLAGGVRKYVFGFDANTIQSPNLAGAEIRFIEGAVVDPVWEDMTPLGDQGFYTSSVEMIIPVSGEYTFALRAVNTDGILSTGMLTTTVNLTRNTGEIITDVEEEQESIAEQITDLFEADVQLANDIIAEIADRVAADLEQANNLTQEIADRLAADLEQANNLSQEIADRAAGDLAQANNLAQEIADRAAADLAVANAAADALLGEQLAREAAITNEQTLRQTADDSLASAISTLAAGTGEQFDSAKVWYFDTDLESWSGNFTPTVVNGFLRPGNGTLSHVQSPDNININADTYKYLKLRIRKVGNPSWVGAMYWNGAGDTSFSEARRVNIPVPAFQADGDATLDWKDLTWTGTLRRLRFVLGGAQSATDYFLIDWVAVGRPSPGASVAALQDEATARVNGDAAEATQRTTLATQMRGSYTGTDIAALTSGLLYNERVARSTADSAMVSNITALDTRLTSAEGVNTSQATAISNLTTRVTSAEGTITSHSSSITSLEGRITSAEGVNTSQATAISGLETRMTSAEGVNTSQASSITNLTTRVTNAEGTIGTQATAISNLTTRVASAEGVNTAQGTAITALDTRLTSAEGVNTSQATAITNLTTRVTSAEGTITSHSSSITSLEGRITSAEGVNTTQATAISGLETRMTSAEGVNTSQATSITNLTTRVTNAEGTIGTQGTAISNLTTRVSTAEGTITSQGTAITNLTASLSSIGGDNLLPNSSFEEQASANRARHWTASNGGTGTITGFVASFVASPLPASTNALRLEASALASTKYLESQLGTTDGMARPKASPGERHTLSVMARGTPGATFAMYVQYMNATNVLATKSVNVPITDTFTRYTLTSDAAPADTTQMGVYAGRLFGAAGDPARWLELDNVQLQEGTVATAYQPSAKLNSDANAAATTALDARVTSAEGTITSHSSSITSLEGRITSAEGVNTSQATAISGLDTRLTSAEGVNTSQATSISNLTSRITSAEGTITSQGTAITNLTTRVTNAEGVNTAQGTAITALDTRLTSAEGVNTSQATAISGLDTRLTSAEGTITSQGTAITNVQASITNKSFLGGNGTNILWEEFTQWRNQTLPTMSVTEGTLTQVADAASPGGYFLRATTTGTSTAAVIRFAASNDDHNLQLEPGRYLLSFDAWANVAGHLIQPTLRNQAGSIYSDPDIPSGNVTLTTTRARYVVAITLPAGTTAGQVRFRHNMSGVSGRQINFDKVMLEKAVGTEKVASQWTPGMPTRIVALKADASAVTALDARVTSVEGVNTTQASAITSLQSSVGGGGNLLANTDFEVDTSEWAFRWNPAGFGPLTRNLSGDTRRPTNGFVAGATRGGTPPTDANGYCVAVSSTPVPIKAGDRVCVRARTAAHRCGVSVGMVFLGPSNENLGEPRTAWQTSGGGQNLSDWADQYLFATAPANTRSVIMAIWVNTRGEGGTTTGNDPFFWFFQPQMHLATAAQILPPPYSPGSGRIDSKYAGITQTMQTSIVTTQNGVNTLNARYTLALDVNGYVSGIRSENTGVTSTFDILADQFKLANPSGADSLTWENGVMVARSGAYMKVTGKGFGVGSALIEWYGPVMAISACSTSNSIYHMTKTGSAYFGGTLSAGTLHSAGRWNLNATNWQDPTYATCTHVGSNGAPKTIVISASIWHSAAYPGNVVSSYPSRTGSVTVGLFRGSTELARWTVTASSGATFYPLEAGNPDSNYTENRQYWDFGSQTVTDNIGTTGNINYTLKVISTSGTRYDVTGGLFTIVVTEQ